MIIKCPHCDEKLLINQEDQSIEKLLDTSCNMDNEKTLLLEELNIEFG
ncbi:hypothetical protein GCM10023310_70980 [Paenibacillus vulneris]